MGRCDLGLPLDFVVGEALVGGDRHEAGRAAAREALALVGSRGTLDYDGTRPIVVGDDLRISITHGRRRAFAIVGRAARLGIDLADEDKRLPARPGRDWGTGHTFGSCRLGLACCLGEKEPGRKGWGRGLLDGDMFDDCVVHVTSLAPPRIRCTLAKLELVVRIVPEGALAIAYER